MPIYEFYCSDCHTIYTFFSRAVDTEKTPCCPHCEAATLTREISCFAALSSSEHGGQADGLAGDLPLDEHRLQAAMESVAANADRIDENDPKQAAELMRGFSKAAGVEFTGSIEEALHRMESGEDPEAIEAEMGERMGFSRCRSARPRRG